MAEETEERRAERIADVLSDPDWIVCNCVYELGHAAPDCPHCDGQGGWPADDDYTSPCPACGGEQIEDHGGPCAVCRGEGVLPWA